MDIAGGADVSQLQALLAQLQQPTATAAPAAGGAPAGSATGPPMGIDTSSLQGILSNPQLAEAMLQYWRQPTGVAGGAGQPQGLSSSGIGQQPELGGPPDAAAMLRSVMEASATLRESNEPSAPAGGAGQAAGGEERCGARGGAGDASVEGTDGGSASSPSPSSQADGTTMAGGIKPSQRRPQRQASGSLMPSGSLPQPTTAGGNAGGSGSGGGSGSALNTPDAHGMSKSKIREKNRQAQRRFRERQRTLIQELRVQVELLCKTVKDQQSEVERLQHENRLMKMLLHTLVKGNGTPPVQ